MKTYILGSITFFFPNIVPIML